MKFAYEVRRADGQPCPVLHVPRPQCALSDLLLDEDENWQVQSRCELSAAYEVTVDGSAIAACPRHAEWVRETYDATSVRQMLTL